MGRLLRNELMHALEGNGLSAALRCLGSLAGAVHWFRSRLCWRRLHAPVCVLMAAAWPAAAGGCWLFSTGCRLLIVVHAPNGNGGCAPVQNRLQHALSGKSVWWAAFARFCLAASCLSACMRAHHLSRQVRNRIAHAYNGNRRWPAIRCSRFLLLVAIMACCWPAEASKASGRSPPPVKEMVVASANITSDAH